MNRDVCEHFNPVDLPCDKCKQPTALYLAEVMESATGPSFTRSEREAIAVELRRLTAQRDALLEALKTVEWHGAGSCWVVDADKIAAAIAKAEENNT